MSQNLPEKAVHLSDRALLRIYGPEAKAFLQNVITNDMDKIEGGILYACLLTPQGQYLHDFFILAREDYYLLDVEAAGLDDLLRRFTMFKLRAKVNFEKMNAHYQVYAVGKGEGAADPRLPDLGDRLYITDRIEHALPVEHYFDFCIDLVVPCGTETISTRDTLADVNLDHLNAVAWDKGCFIGQEVAARMHHRGLAKKRLFRIDGPELAPGQKLLQNGREVGEIRQIARSGTRALAQIKLTAATHALLPVLTEKGHRLVLTPAKYLDAAAG